MKKKFNSGKSQLILSATVLLIAIVSYLDYIELNDDVVEITTIGDVNITLENLPLTVDESKEEGEAILVNAQINKNYFTEAKLNREQSRSKQRELLLKITNNDKLSLAEKTEFTDRISEIQDKTEKETATEFAIKSKGFRNVYVRIEGTTVDVVVDKENLSDKDAEQIRDIVMRKTKLPATAVKISPYRNNK